MKRVERVVVLVALAITMSALPAVAQDSKVEAAMRYLKVVPVENIMNEMSRELLKVAPEDQKAFVKEALAGVDRKKIEKATIDAMVKHFTVKEMNALTNFYTTPEGRSVMKKMPAMQAEMLPVIQTEIAGALQRAFENLQQKGK